MATKVTFTLDDETVQRIADAADRLRKPKSQVVREAVADYHERLGHLSETERRRLLRVVDDVVSRIPRRAEADILRELESIRQARSSGGRGGRRRA